jgi:hypothetical protein
MSELIVKYPDRTPDHFPLGRLRITIGRSARNDLCIPDPFASRVHAEVRREAGGYAVHPAGVAGMLLNGQALEGSLVLHEGDTLEKRHAVATFLKAHGYRVAQVTLNFDDYAYNDPYTRCVAKNDAAAIEGLKHSYLSRAAQSIDAGQEAARGVGSKACEV